MTQQIPLERYTNDLFSILEETFENVQRSIYLDRDTSLFETLDTITAEEASNPVSATCATLAAQVEHVRFYVDVLEQLMIDPQSAPSKLDWGEIWRTVSAVSPEAWEASKARLKASYTRLMTRLRGMETWDGEEDIGVPMAIAVHTAYHLGEIRQALCTIKAR